MSESRHAQYRSFLLWRHNQVICSNAFNDTARHTCWSKIQKFKDKDSFLILIAYVERDG